MADIHSSYINSLKEMIENWLDTEVGKKSKWGQYIKYTPDLFHLLIKLSADKIVSKDCKAKLASAISYFVSPYDFIPEEYWGALGYVDDIALAAYVLDIIIRDNGIETVNTHWNLEQDIHSLIANILNVAEEMVGDIWWHRLKELVDE